MQRQDIFIIEPESSEQANALKAFIKALKMKFEVKGKPNNSQINQSENLFQLSDGQKKILDSQDELPISEYQDNDDFVAELKKEYGL